MSRLALAAALTLTVFACSKPNDSVTSAGSSGSAATGSAATGSAATGSAMAGSGLATAGSGSAGSGSAGGRVAPPPEDDGFHFEVTTPFESNTFEKLEEDMQIKFMRQFVVPQMKVEFQAFDSKKYANFGCKTCHGKSFKEKHYKMPNPDLPKLDFAKLKAGMQEPKMARFMELHINPDMAKILNLTPSDEQHPDGFGCFHCHEMKK